MNFTMKIDQIKLWMEFVSRANIVSAQSCHYMYV